MSHMKLLDHLMKLCVNMKTLKLITLWHMLKVMVSTERDEHSAVE